jgi:hypothetical protein
MNIKILIITFFVDGNYNDGFINKIWIIFIFINFYITMDKESIESYDMGPNEEHNEFDLPPQADDLAEF